MKSIITLITMALIASLTTVSAAPKKTPPAPATPKLQTIEPSKTICASEMTTELQQKLLKDFKIVSVFAFPGEELLNSYIIYESKEANAKGFKYVYMIDEVYKIKGQEALDVCIVAMGVTKDGSLALAQKSFEEFAKQSNDQKPTNPAPATPSIPSTPAPATPKLEAAPPTEQE